MSAARWIACSRIARSKWSPWADVRLTPVFVVPGNNALTVMFQRPSSRAIARHADQRRFRSSVVQVAGSARNDDGGGQVDDPAPLRPLHRRHDGARTQERAGDVHVDRATPFSERQFPERPNAKVLEHGRVVDEHVDAAKGGKRAFGQIGDRDRVRDIGPDRERAVPLSFEFLLQGDRRLAVAFGDHRDGALLGEMPDEGTAQSLAAAGHDRDPTLERRIERGCRHAWFAFVGSRTPDQVTRICTAHAP